MSRFTSIGHERGLTLAKLIIGTAGAVLIVSALVLPFSRYFLRIANSQMKVANYPILLQMCNEIQQAKELTAYSSSRATFRDLDDSSFQFVYDPGAQTVSRIDGSRTNIYLRNCDQFQFRAYEPQIVSNRFDADYVPIFVTNARIVQVTWHCADRIRGTALTIDSGESVRVTIRNQWLRRF